MVLTDSGVKVFLARYGSHAIGTLAVFLGFFAYCILAPDCYPTQHDQCVVRVGRCDTTRCCWKRKRFTEQKRNEIGLAMESDNNSRTLL